MIIYSMGFLKIFIHDLQKNLKRLILWKCLFYSKVLEG